MQIINQVEPKSKLGNMAIHTVLNISVAKSASKEISIGTDNLNSKESYTQVKQIKMKSSYSQTSIAMNNGLFKRFKKNKK